MKTYTTLLCIIFLSGLAVPVLGFDANHPGEKYCQYCHDKLGAPDDVRFTSGCSGACHMSKPNKFSDDDGKPWYFQQRYPLHMRNSVCMKCHAKGTDDIHTVHTDFNVRCLNCHSSKGYTSEIVNVPSQNTADSFAKPASKECKYCHLINGSRLHDVHAARLEKACPTCHGDRIEPKRSNAGFEEKYMAEAVYREESIMPVRVITRLVDGVSSEIKEIVGLAFRMI